MAKPLIITVKESNEDLEQYVRIAKTRTKKKRLKILIEIKNAGITGISKRDLSSKLNLNHNTVQIWRKKYETEGISAFLEDGRRGFKPSEITAEEHDSICAKLQRFTRIYGIKALV